MEEVERKPYEQYRSPQGKTGREILALMNEKHYRLTTWGLGKIKIKPDDTILDIGCGGGRTVARLAKAASRGAVYGIDHAEESILYATAHNREAVRAGKVSILKADADDLPFLRGTFDKVTAVETTYFWPDLLKCFGQVFHVLKPGGTFLIVNEAYEDPAFAERNAALKQDGNLQLFTPEQVKKLLHAAGFSRVSIYLEENQNWICCKAQK